MELEKTQERTAELIKDLEWFLKTLSVSDYKNNMYSSWKTWKIFKAKENKIIYYPTTQREQCLKLYFLSFSVYTNIHITKAISVHIYITYVFLGLPRFC